MSFPPRRGPAIATQNTDEPGTVAKSWRLLKFASLGIEMAVATFIGWGIGYWLDLQLGTEPWLMLVFLLCGVAAGFKGVFRAAREAQEVMGDRPPRAPAGLPTSPGPAAEAPGAVAAAPATAEPEERT